jgi:putative DNA-invertase from lambdoid prophage Rac
MRAALYARVSKSDQQTLPMQMEAMVSYARNRGWEIVNRVAEISSGTKERRKREEILKEARRRSLDVIVVWKLDRWGRSLPDLVNSLRELSLLGVGFVSLTEALDLTSPIGRAMAGLLSVFAEFERDVLSERIRAGIAQARDRGKPHGRPKTAALRSDEIRKLFANGLSKSEIARKLGIGRTSVIRILNGCH